MLLGDLAGYAMTITALLLAPFFMMAFAPLPEAASFVSGVWKGEANYDSEGNFRDCTMTAQSEAGVLLGFVISKDFDWGLVLADEEREFVVGSSHAVLLLVDARDPIPALAKVVDPHGILIPLDTSDPVLEAMREGKVLTIQTEGMKVSFKLTGTRDAIAELAACVTENKTTEKVQLPTTP